MTQLIEPVVDSNDQACLALVAGVPRCVSVAGKGAEIQSLVGEYDMVFEGAFKKPHWRKRGHYVVLLVYEEQGDVWLLKDALKHEFRSPPADFERNPTPEGPWPNSPPRLNPLALPHRHEQ